MLTKEDIFKAISTVMDPEIGFNLVELGLIYDANILEDGGVEVIMTLSTQGCPLHQAMQEWVEQAVVNICDVPYCNVNIVWEPQWNIDMAAPHVKETLENNFSILGSEWN